MGWASVSGNPDLGNTNLYIAPNVVLPTKTVGTAADVFPDWENVLTNIYILPGGGGGGGGGEIIYVPVSVDKESWT